MLAVSQFTLYGDAKKGRRPSWSAAAPGAVSEPLFTTMFRRCVSVACTWRPACSVRTCRWSWSMTARVTLILDSETL